jgi:hypothetical protein
MPRIIETQMLASRFEVEAQYFTDQPAFGFRDQFVLAVDQPVAAEEHPGR